MTNDFHMRPRSISDQSVPVETQNLNFGFGRKRVLEDVTFSIPRGAFYALLGANGAGKTTLMQVLMGIRREYTGHAFITGRECRKLRVEDRQRVGYVAEGLKLPAWMRLEQLEAYLAPLYPTWDHVHATALRKRFDLDPDALIGKMSRGQYMKAALLCALSSRPELLILDEPFTGMDVSVKDELVRGLLSASSGDGCTILLSSHDIGELELLADWVGFLGERTMQMSESMDTMRARFKHVDVLLKNDVALETNWSDDWRSIEQSGRRLQFVTASTAADAAEQALYARLPDAQRIETRDATLKEVFIALKHQPAVVSSMTDDREVSK